MFDSVLNRKPFASHWKKRNPDSSPEVKLRTTHFQNFSHQKYTRLTFSTPLIKNWFEWRLFPTSSLCKICRRISNENTGRALYYNKSNMQILVGILRSLCRCAAGCKTLWRTFLKNKTKDSLTNIQPLAFYMQILNEVKRALNIDISQTHLLINLALLSAVDEWQLSKKLVKHRQGKII